MAELVFEENGMSVEAVQRDRRPVVVIGRKGRLVEWAAELACPSEARSARSVVQAVATGASGGDEGAVSKSLVDVGGDQTRLVALGTLPEACSRHNCPARPHATAKTTAEAVNSSDEAEWLVVVVLDKPSYKGAAACAVARALPLYSRKTTRGGKKKRVTVAFFDAENKAPSPLNAAHCAVAAAAVRKCARIVDTPPAEMNVDELIAEARRVADSADNCSVEVVRGDDLDKRGYGCLYGVGKAATQPPALVILSHSRVSSASSSEQQQKKHTGCAVLCGKGIVYDTGGLALKPKEGMHGMKMDLGGAACVLAAFEAAVTSGDYAPYSALHCILCVAENAIGPLAVRHDDVLTSLSGKTVELNNTDAEGRLVLADGVAHASKPHAFPQEVSLIIDAATLTGAQMVATGKRVCAVCSNDAAAEAGLVAAGRVSGDLAHPLVFIPEWHQSEFKSQVADMKNSVKDRGNAQTSCAATFIYSHLHPDYLKKKGAWLHLDIAGPAFNAERGTGFGVALILAFLQCKPFL